MKDPDEVRLYPRRIACLLPEAETTTIALKAFLRRRVYFCEELLEERRRVGAMLGELFVYFVEHPEGLPPAFLERAGGVALHRSVCDYIAGMTDGYFRRVYRGTFQIGE